MDVVPLGPGFGAELRGKAHRLWHPDSPFQRVPAPASILWARNIPAIIQAAE